MDSLRGLLGMRRIDKAPNSWMRELCGVTKRVNERIDESVSDGLTILKEWRMIRLLKGCMWESVWVVA